MHILRDTAEICGALQQCRCTNDTYIWYIINWTYFWRLLVMKWWQWKMNIVSCKVVTIANYNKKYKTLTFVILFIHYSSCCILCLNVLYYFVITICLITLKHLACLFLYSLCFYLYIWQCNGGFYLHMYFPLYFLVYIYYIIITYL